MRNACKSVVGKPKETTLLVEESWMRG